MENNYQFAKRISGQKFVKYKGPVIRNISVLMVEYEKTKREEDEKKQKEKEKKEKEEKEKEAKDKKSKDEKENPNP